ncbi:MAG: PAS domain-containing protein [Planctomycetia bacterium]|nr:PAS domain-containing protein [Planctomycetia bacterium]
MSATDSNTDSENNTPGFFWQLYSIYALLILIGVSFFGYLLYERFSNDLFLNLKTHMDEQSSNILSLETPPNTENPLQLIQNTYVSMSKETRVDLISADGTTVILQDPISSPLESPQSLPDVISCLKNSVGFSSFNRAAAQERQPAISRVFTLDNNQKYILRIARNPASINAQIDSVLESVIMLGSIAALIAMVMGHLLYRRINRQFHLLTQVAVAYTEGDFSIRAPKGMDKEGDLLGNALNKLADELQMQISEMHLEHNRLRVILGGMRDGLIAIDDQERIVLINSVISRIMGFEIREVRGQYIRDVIHESAIVELLLSTLRMQHAMESEIELSSNNSTTYLKAYTSPLIDADHGVSGSLIVLHDLTGNRLLESMRRDFVANVSHELKTPITAIRGIAETLYDDEEMKPEIRQRFLGKITDQSHRLSTLVSDLLALARLDERDSTTIEPIDLREIILERINSLSKVSSPDSQASLHYHGPEHPVFVMGDDEELRQAIGNLIDNGLKYTQIDGNINTHLSVEDGTAIVLVKDDGIGIPEEFLGRIFERFFRVDKARSREIGGTGLGLAIVKHICLKHMGSIEVESQEGKGTTFRVKLPIFNERSSSESHTE